MRRETARVVLVCVAICALISVVGCGSTATTAGPVPPPATGEEVRSNKARNTSPDVPPDHLATLVRGNTEFALALYQRATAGHDNLFFSPFSVSLAFSMLYAGAAGTTASQMAEALHYHLAPPDHHAAFNKLDLELASRGGAPPAAPAQRPDGFQLSIANAMWGQTGFPFGAGFLDTLAQNYGAGLRLADFIADPDGWRERINNWVAQQTRDKIRDILPPRSITDATRFVLANAIYFLAAWEDEFDAASTAPEPFHGLSGHVTTVPMMHQTTYAGYVQGDGFQAVALPYKGGKLDMVVLLPAGGQFQTFEAALTSERLATIFASLTPSSVVLGLPRFRVETSLDLIPLLRALGLTDAFTPTAADFTGICTSIPLFVDVALHRAFVSVDEAGTEAGAATVIGGATTSMPEIVMIANRPFVFLIRDLPTGTVLFLGRVTAL